MAVRPVLFAVWTAAGGLLAGCSSPFDVPREGEALRVQPPRQNNQQLLASRYRAEEIEEDSVEPPSSPRAPHPTITCVTRSTTARGLRRRISDGSPQPSVCLRWALCPIHA